MKPLTAGGGGGAAEQLLMRRAVMGQSCTLASSRTGPRRLAQPSGCTGVVRAFTRRVRTEICIAPQKRKDQATTYFAGDRCSTVHGLHRQRPPKSCLWSVSQTPPPLSYLVSPFRGCSDGAPERARRLPDDESSNTRGALSPRRVPRPGAPRAGCADLPPPPLSPPASLGRGSDEYAGGGTVGFL